LKSAYAAYQGEQWWAVAVGEEVRARQEPEADQEQETDQTYVDLIAAAESAHNSEPGNVKYGYWLNFYRWQSLSRAVDPETGHVLLHPEVLPFVDRIADQLAQGRTVCPTYGPPYTLEGQLRLSVLKQETGADLIRKGYSLAPYDPPTCLVAGKLAASDGQLDEARQRLDRAIRLNPAYFGEVAETYLFDLNRPDWAQALAAQDNSRLYVRLRQLATLCARDTRYEQLGHKLRAASEVELRRLAATEQSTAYGLAALARIDFDRNDFDSAVALYRRSLVLDYARVDRRLMLAKALAKLARNDEAIHEARICLRLKPGLKEARDLIGRLAK
jgi:tetratricopeptide (TPR) repeat protein